MLVLRLLLGAFLLFTTIVSVSANGFVPFRSDAPFYYQEGRTTVFFREKGISFVFHQSQRATSAHSRLYRMKGDADVQQAFRIDFNAVGSSLSAPKPTDFTEETIRFITSEDQKTVQTAKKITYTNLYPNIDWVFYITESGQLKYDFVLHPGADPQAIRLQVQGSERIQLSKEGILSVQSPFGSWQEEIPCAFVDNQAISGVKYRLNGDEITFNVPHYDRKKTLVIDPLVRVWATHFGGSMMEHISDLATDTQNNVYMTGFTASPDLPVSVGTITTKYLGKNDAFVACFAPSGERKWATYFGGKLDDQATAIALSINGKIAVTGLTNSDKLPSSEKKNTGGTDVFLLELNNDGSVNYVTLFGGKVMDEGVGIGYDQSGGIIIAGTTESSDFPVIPPAFQSRFSAGGSDAFLIRLDENKKRSWATFLGGGLPDVASDMVVYQNMAYLTGTTQSSNFPLSGTATITTRQIDPVGDAFIACFTTDGKREWTTAIGGRNRDEGLAITVDNEGTPTICGLTISQDFPVTKNAFQDRPKGLAEGFISQFTSAGEPLWSTFIGGSMIDHCFGITSAKNNKSLIITGKTNSKNFPATGDALMYLTVGMFDAFVAQFSNVGKQLWTTYYGSSNDDEAYALATDFNHATYVGGRTAGRNFPVTANAFQPQLKNNWDAFLIKFEEKNPDAIVDEKPAFTPREIPPDENIFTFKAVVKNVSCKGGSDGAIDLTVTGGTPPYTFAWSNGATTEDLKNIPAGKYTVTVTDVNGLSQAYYIETGHNVYKESAIEVKEPANGIQITLTPVAPACPNTKDGKILSVISGGQAPFTTRWSNGSTESALKGVEAGTYSVTVTDASGCQATATTKLDVPMALSASAQATNASCGTSADGKIILTVTGGTPPYGFNWSNGQKVKDQLNLAGGNYSVTITDKNGCSTSVTSIVSQGAALTATVTASSAKCDGLNDASVKVTLNGGTPPFTYKWSNQSVLKDLLNVGPGTYSVTITDKNNCSATGSAVVSQAVPMTLTLNSTNPLCFDTPNGAIEATVAGGKEPYIFAWSNQQGGAKIIRLPEGTYTLTVTDANGCKKTATATLKRPAQLTASIQSEGGSCTEPNKPAKLSLTITGGTTPHQIAWSNGSNQKEILNAPAGDYSATITDAYGCSTIVKSSIKQFSSMQVTVMVKEVGCEGGSTAGIDISPVGGQPPVTFVWSNGQKTEDLSAIPAGTYTVTLTDANKCIFNQTITIKPKEPLKITEKVTAISCHNGNNGEIEITVTGGTAPYTYQWSTGATGTNKISALNASSYEVQVTDASGCKARKEIKVIQPEPLTVKTKSVNASCEKGNDGKVEGIIAGGTPPYKYEWSNGATTPNLAGIPDGTYTLKVIDSKGCTAIGNTVITRPKPFSIEVTKTDLTCGGINDGSATVTVKEGTPPFTYAWSNGLTTAEIKNQKEGVLTVTVTDAAGCKQSGSVTLSRPPAITVNVKINNITCSDLTNGKVEAIVLGGTAPFSYKWSNGNTLNFIENVAEGSYTVTVSDAKGCIKTETATVKKPAPLAVALNPKNVSCKGTNDASINAKISGGTEPYKFAWSNSAVSQNLTNVEAGTYTLTVTDANGCTANGSATIIKPASVSVSIDKKDLSCLGQNDGSAKAVVSGGKEPFTFAWSTGWTKQDIAGLKEGILSVTVTDGNGCKADAQVTLSRPPAMTLKVTKKDISCSAVSDGSAEAIITGGKEPFTYKWSNDKQSAKIENLADGAVTVIVTDANGCSQTATTNIKRPTPLTATLNGKNVSCNGTNDASVFAKISGGTEPYKFAWSNSAVSQNLSNIEAGTYALTVTDANGCTANGSATVIKPASVTVSIDKKDLSCEGKNDGSAKAVVSGGKEPFTFAWSTGWTKQEIAGVKEGDLSVTVTDANGCKANASVKLNRPPALTLKVIKKNISCANASDGSAEAIITGGKEPFTYKWSNEKQGAKIENLSDGDVTVIVMDANGCSQTATANIKRPAPLSATLTGKNVSCNGTNDASVFAKISGGTEPYKFSWSNSAVTQNLTNIEAGTYTLTVTDANGCTANGSATVIKPDLVTVSIVKKDLSCSGQNDGSAKAVVTGGKEPFTYAWSSGGTKSEVAGLKEGVLSVTATDANGCKAEAKVTLARPAALTVKTSKKEITCANVSDGKAEVKILTGQEPFTYAWSNGKTTANVEELGEGTFTVTVTDANNCKQTASVTFKKPLAVTVNVTSKNVSCGGTNDGSASAKAYGGNEPYKYLWSNGTATAQVANLEPGTYKLTVTDANGCVGEATATITKPDALSVTIDKKDLTCTGTNDGSAKAVISGGKAPFSYAWSNLLTTQEVKNQKEGELSVSVTDANGCKASAKITLAKPPSLTIKTTVKNLSCGDAVDGKVELTVSGGKEPFTYTWSNQKTSASIENLGDGTFTVTVSDANGCKGTATSTVKKPENIKITLSANDLSCSGKDDGKISAKVAGGTAPYTYKWSNGSSETTLSDLKEGTYTLTLTDANGCKAENKAELKRPASMNVRLESSDVKCYGGKDGSVKVIITGGTEPFAFSWSSGEKTKNLSGIGKGDYAVTVTDAKGCTQNQQVTITQPDQPIIRIDGSEQICEGQQRILSVAEGFKAYKWSSGETASSITVAKAGTYSVEMTTESGCKTTAKAVKLTLATPPATPKITVKGDTLWSSEAERYQWFMNNVMIPSGINRYFIAKEKAEYKVRIGNESGCTAFSAPVSVTPKAQPSKPKETAISLYPNPTTRATYLKIINTNMEALDVKITDPNGKVVFSTIISALDKSFEEEIVVKEDGGVTGKYIITVKGKSKTIKETITVN